MERKNRILFVDDDIVERMNFERVARDEAFPFEFVLASSVKEADKLLELQQFDAIITDYQLGDGTAFDLFNYVQQTPFIVVTGTGNQEIAVNAMKQGAYDYLIKDSESNHLKTLTMTVENAINRKLAEEELLRYREHLEELVQSRTMALLKEIDERKRAENALRELNEQLEYKVSERTENLRSINQRLSKSLQILREDEEAGKVIQSSLLPEQSLKIHDFYCTHFFQPSMYLSGDFVDYFEIDSRHFGFYMADVAGHGASSAFITVLIKMYMLTMQDKFEKQQEATILHPDWLLPDLNQMLLKRKLGRHVTFFYGVIDTVENKLAYANAGQFPYPIFRMNNRTDAVQAKGNPLGLFDFATYSSTIVELPKEFEIVLFSDGILEILPHKMMAEKLSHLISLVKRTPVEIRSLIQGLQLHKQPSLPDDITILHLKRHQSTVRSD
ncbi:SpoIIE family protein phosphatase [candidate division KSB1 bacterium]|nr:SpoIIE family protein phosphatase [candidate division KSB1 bacterium]